METVDTFMKLAEHAHDAILIIDAGGTVLFANRSALDTLGYGISELKEMTYPDLILPGHGGKAREIRAGGITDIPVEEVCERKMVGKRGTVIAMEISGTKITWDGRDAVMLLARDRKKKKKASRELCAKAKNRAEEKYRTIVENSVSGLFQITPEGRFIMANPACARMLGYDSPDELVRNVSDVGSQIYADSGDRKKLMKDLSRGGVIRDFRTRLKKRDGTMRWVSVSCRAIYDRDGKHILNEGSFEDVTDRVTMGEALRQSEERYRLIFENIGNSTIIIEEDATISTVNSEFETLSGYSKDEVEGKKRFTDFIDEKEAKRLRELHLRRVKGDHDEPIRYETYFHTKKGERKDVLATVILLPGTKRCIGSVIDITARRQAERKLSQSEETTRTLLNATDASALLVDCQGRIVAANRRAKERIGAVEHDLVNRNFGEHVQSRLARTRRDQLARTLALKYPVHYTEEIDGRVMAVTIYPVFDAPGKIALCAVYSTDVTEQRAAEENLRKSEERLRTVLENMPVMLAATDKRGRITVWNAACESVTGYSREEMRKTDDFLKVLYPDPVYRASLLSEMESNKGAFSNRETALTCRDGTLKTVSWSNKSKEFAIPGWKLWAIGFDMTEIRKAEEYLKNVNAELGRQVSERTRDLNLKANKLEETNAALRTLLKTAEDFKEEMETRILTNITQIIMPYLEKLKKSQLSADQMTYCHILETHVRHITSPFARKLSPPYLNFTPREIKIATLIRDHKTTKEIARLLNISESAVIFHRHNIRKKLGVVSKRVNLETHLQSFS